MKLVLRLDVGRWSRILRVWEIVKNRDLTPDSGRRAEDRRRRTEGGSQKVEDRGQYYD